MENKPVIKYSSEAPPRGAVDRPVVMEMAVAEEVVYRVYMEHSSSPEFTAAWCEGQDLAIPRRRCACSSGWESWSPLD